MVDREAPASLDDADWEEVLERALYYAMRILAQYRMTSVQAPSRERPFRPSRPHT